jgi:hypothetical protein
MEQGAMQLGQLKKQNESRDAFGAAIPEPDRLIFNAFPEQYATSKFKVPEKPQLVTIDTPNGPMQRWMRPGESAGVDVGAPAAPIPTGMVRGQDGKLVYDPGYLSGQQEIRAAGKAETTIKMPPMQTKFGEAVGKAQGEEYTGILKAGFNASGTLANLNRIESLMDGVQTGKLTPLTKDISSMAASVGVNISDKLPQQEAIAALSNEMALKAKNSGGENMMPGAMSDPDRRFLVEMVPNLVNTPGGNKLIIETLKRKAKRDQDIAKMARAYVAKKGDYEGFTDELMAWSDKNPLFSDLMPKTQGAPQGAVRRIR